MITHMPRGDHATRATRAMIDSLEPRRLCSVVSTIPGLTTDAPQTDPVMDDLLPATSSEAPPAFPVLPGDANRDRTCDLTDFTILAAHFGQTDQGWQTGDFTSDGTVDVQDFTILASNFNKTV